MEFEVGLWRSTLGETHPHVGFDVEMDFWPQAAHVTGLEYEGTATYRVGGGLVGCFAGGGGGSQKALFRNDLVPLLRDALERWRDSPQGNSARARLDGFLREVQRGFDASSVDEQFDASTASMVLASEGAAIATTGLERAIHVRAGRAEIVSRRQSEFDRVSPEDRANAPEHVAELLGSLSASRLRKTAAAATQADWQIVDLPLVAGDVVVLVAGLPSGGVSDSVLLDAIAAATSKDTAPLMARALGEHLASPLSWPSPPDAPHRVRWTVISRASLAFVRAR